jgi:hypothetical protein
MSSTCGTSPATACALAFALTSTTCPVLTLHLAVGRYNSSAHCLGIWLAPNVLSFAIRGPPPSVATAESSRAVWDCSAVNSTYAPGFVLNVTAPYPTTVNLTDFDLIGPASAATTGLSTGFVVLTSMPSANVLVAGCTMRSVAYLISLSSFYQQKPLLPWTSVVHVHHNAGTWIIPPDQVPGMDVLGLAGVLNIGQQFAETIFGPTLALQIHDNVWTVIPPEGAGQMPSPACVSLFVLTFGGVQFSAQIARDRLPITGQYLLMGAVTVGLELNDLSSDPLSSVSVVDVLDTEVNGVHLARFTGGALILLLAPYTGSGTAHVHDCVVYGASAWATAVANGWDLPVAMSGADMHLRNVTFIGGQSFVKGSSPTASVYLSVVRFFAGVPGTWPVPGAQACVTTGGGRLTGVQVTFDGCSTDLIGGGLLARDTVVTLQHSLFTGCSSVVRSPAHSVCCRRTDVLPSFPVCV